MRILLVNDDGIAAPGLRALYDACAGLGQIDVVAPQAHQSGMAHAITVYESISAQRVQVDEHMSGWAVDGRPADCVKLALAALLDEPPDLVLSGINAGTNVGIYAVYSGTVAAAGEGALAGIPALGFSLELKNAAPDFATASRLVRQVLDTVLQQSLPAGMCLSVNIPALDDGPPRGIRCCPQAAAAITDQYAAKHDNGRTTYQLTGLSPAPELCPGTDLAAVRSGYIAVTPLKFDLTDHDVLARTTEWAWPTPDQSSRDTPAAAPDFTKSLE